MAWEHRGRVAVAGVGFSSIERPATMSLAAHARLAAEAAVADCGLGLGDIDGLSTYPLAPYAGALNRNGEDVIEVEFFLSDPRLGEVAWYAQTGQGMIVSALRDAAHALISGACRYVLLWRAMYVPSGTYGHADPGDATGDEQFTKPYGCVSPIQWHAFNYRRYQDLYGATREAMATLAVSSRANAQRNEHAVFAGVELTREDYLAARMISDPLCLYDCDMPVTGCVALVLTTAERATDLAQPPAYLAAVGQQTTAHEERLYFSLHDHIECGKPLADRLWADAALGPADMAAAQLYDGFSPSTLYWLEAAGFCGRGEAHEFIQGGRIEHGGALPVNTSGGSLSEGRMHGMGHIAEAALQVAGRAGPRQVPDAGAVCVLDGSPMMRGGGLIFTSDP